MFFNSGNFSTAISMQLKARKRKGTLEMDTASSRKKVKQGTDNASRSTADIFLYSREPVQRVLNTESSRDFQENSLGKGI